MYSLRQSAKFRRDVRRLLRQGKDLQLLDDVIQTLLAGKKLDFRYKDHALKGEFADLRECHIQPDWLLLYKKEKGTLILTALRTGSHSELLNM